MPEVQVPPKKPKQDFTVGNTIRIGGNEYKVTGQRPPPAKGQAAIIELESLDASRKYEWQPFRGLRVIGGKPKRIRKRRKKGAPPVVAHTPQRIEGASLWTRLVRRVFKDKP